MPADLTSRRVLWNSGRFPSLETAADAVKLCGAKGDGKADDTLPLQHCLDTHDQVLLPKGLFRISATLTMRPGTALLGISQTHSVIAPLTARPALHESTLEYPFVWHKGVLNGY